MPPATTHRSIAARTLLAGVLAAVSTRVSAEDGTYGMYGEDGMPALGLECGEGYQPALLHTFGGVYDEGAFDAEITAATSSEFRAVLDNTEMIAGLPASAVSTAEDADPASSTPFTAGAFGGFLLFSHVDGISLTPPESAEAYWDSPPHVAFGPTYVSTVSLDADGRGAATVQVPLCIPSDFEGLGSYHMAIVIDVAEGSRVDSEECRGTLVDTLNAIADAAGDAAAVPGLCGRQWADWETLSFAEGINGFDFNKANSADDVGCVYNFESPEARDMFATRFSSMWELASGTPLDTEACIGKYWAWSME